MTGPAAIPFVNPGFLWACVALALIPIIIYILNRRRHRNVPWAAMMFLLAANKKTLRRTRLEQLLLMAVRITLITLLGLAMARPVLHSGAAPSALTDGMHHIFILDDSFSMSAASQSTPDSIEAGDRGRSPTDPLRGRTALDTQIEQARMLLQEFPSGDPITIITMGYPARVLHRKPLFDRALASRLIQTTRPGYSHTDLLGALLLARELIDSQKDERLQQAVYLFSDFAKATLHPALNSQHSAPSTVGRVLDPTPTGDTLIVGSMTRPTAMDQSSIKTLAREITKHARLVLYDVFDDQTANLANTELRLMNNLVGTGQVTEVVNTIANISDRRSAESKVQLSVDGKRTRQFTLEPLEAGGSRTLSYAIEFGSPGLHTIETTLEVAAGNALRLDDSRRLVVDVREQILLLIVDGKPGPTRLRGHAGYVATALAPRPQAGDATLLAAAIITEGELAGRNLSASEVVILCNVRRLGEQLWQRLEKYVREGGGLIVFLGDLVDVDHYNSAGAGALPTYVGTARALLPARLTEAAFADLSDANFVKYDAQTLSDPLLTDFSGRANSGLFRARIHQYIKMATALGQGRTLLAYTNGDPAIVERRVGTGKCVLINTTANMDWTNLPAKGDFITLMMNLVQHAASDNAPGRNFTVAEIFIEEVHTISGSGKEYTIRKPDGSEERLGITSSAGGFQLRFEQLDQAGWYRLHTPEVEGAVSVNLNPAESDLTALDEAEIRRAFDCELEYSAAAPTETQLAGAGRSEFGAMLIYAVLLLLLAETLLALWFDHERR